ncbi:hypothetical protein M0805_000244 [Coniferiporia weirii]|nr:hypothetical protein M0805_000244 [Coniferiporia weirii]
MTSTFDPNTAQNLVEAVEHAQVYWNLLEKVQPKELRLTKIDDEIFEDLSAKFPELVTAPYERLVKLDEDWMKSNDGKKRWREYVEAYKDKVKDYNFGSLIRMDCRDEYGETNTIFVTRMQFCAFEIARNRLGLNDAAHELAIREAEKEKKQKERERLEAEKAKKGKKRS